MKYSVPEFGTLKTFHILMKYEADDCTTVIVKAFDRDLIKVTVFDAFPVYTAAPGNITTP